MPHIAARGTLPRMRRYIRAVVPGATYFFTLTLQDRRCATLIHGVDHLRAAFTEIRTRHPFDIDAMVVLPDHLHLLITLPADDARYAMRLALIKGAFTRRMAAAQRLDSRALQARGARGERSLWQRRYWEHQIRDENDYARHVDYIHFNPVKHGHAARAGDWPYSSFHRYVRHGVLPADWGLAAGADKGGFGERSDWASS
ncbi:transposase [Ramlibacter sp.]|uniref:REP-associated tyrosine transposase n=1 Tax=Ramlibacter sp. TaxID=1917967 RepID=UPI0035B0659E